MRSFHKLNEGDDSIVDRLKRSWMAYRDIASGVLSSFDKDNRSAILTWHYRNFLRLEEQRVEDRNNRRECKYCDSEHMDCSCYSDLKAWWEAAQLIALVQPSSAAAERVFSLVNNMYKSQQSSALTDGIKLSLYLAYNKRDLRVPIDEEES